MAPSLVEARLIAPVSVEQDSKPTQEAATAEFAAASKIYFEQGSKEALPRLQHALESLRAVGDRKTEATALGFIGNCYKHLGDQNAAKDYLTRSLALSRELQDRAQEGKTLNHLGLLAWEMADYPKAVSFFNESAKVASEVGNKQLQASVSNNLGLVFDEQGDYDHSLPQYEKALALDREIKFERGEAETTANIGGVYLSIGHFREAAEKYQNALALANKLGLKPLASQASGNLALCRLALGDAQTAITTFDDALRLASEAGQAKEQADWHKGKGSAYHSLGQFDRARAEYSSAIEQYEKAELKREWVEALLDRGDLYLELGDVSRASAEFVKASSIAREIGFARGVTDGLARAGRIEVRRGRTKEAEQLYRDSLERARTAKQVDIEAGVLILLAELLRESERLTEAMDASAEAMNLAQVSAARMMAASAQYELAESLLKLKRQNEATANFEAAAPIARETGAIDLEWRIAYGYGRALEEVGRTDEAIRSYTHAISLIESVRAQIAEERFRSGYFQDKAEVYVDLVRLLIKLGRVKEALGYSERLRNQNLQGLTSQAPPISQDPDEAELRSRVRTLQKRLETSQHPSTTRAETTDDQLSARLRAAERDYQNLLDDLRAKRPEIVDVADAKEINAEELQHTLPTNSAILEYVVSDTDISEIVVTPKEVWGTTVSAKDVASRVELMRELVQRPDSTDWTSPAIALDRLLIEPAREAGMLKDAQRIYLVPNGVLHYLPFAALARKDTRGRTRLLVQDYELAYLPSAASLRREGRSPPARSLLALAPSVPDLIHTGTEIQNIRQYFPKSNEVLVGSGATKVAFERRATDYRVIHLATHGYFNRFNPMFSGIVLQPTKDDNGRLEVHEILRLRLHSELVTLSACETALSGGYFDEFPAGDEFVGLTRAFLNAGSRAVLASLWSVNDHSTATLMQAFYRQQTRSDRTTALASTQRSMIASGTKYRHPYYWAPFVLTETGKPGPEEIIRKTAASIRVSPTVGSSADVVPRRE